MLPEELFRECVRRFDAELDLIWHRDGLEDGITSTGTAVRGVGIEAGEISPWYAGGLVERLLRSGLDGS